MYRQAKGGRTRRISVGEVCFIKEGSPLCKVLSRLGQQSTVYRPLQKMIPFEIREDCEGQADSNKVEDGGEEDAETNEHAAAVLQRRKRSTLEDQ